MTTQRTWTRRCLVAGAFLTLAACWANPGEVGAAERKRSLFLEPKPIRYHLKKDAIEKYYSVLSPRYDHPPGGPTAYNGNRLTQYQFRGKKGRGGIYDAINSYHQEWKLDPKKYQYRRTR